MKVFSILRNYKPLCDPDWMMLPDSAMIRAGKPVFLPDDNEPFVMLPSLCLRVGRLGKHIAAKFAYRYFDAMAPAVQFMPLTAATEIIEGKSPNPSKVIFDNALICGEFANFSADLNLKMNLTSSTSSKKLEWHSDELLLPPDKILEMVSEFNTVKMGDLILASLPADWLPALRDSSVSLSSDSGIPLEFNIK